jgi:hypothetical protein
MTSMKELNKLKSHKAKSNRPDKQPHHLDTPKEAWKQPQLEPCFYMQSEVEASRRRFFPLHLY